MAWPTAFATDTPQADFRGGDEPRVFYDGQSAGYDAGHTDGYAAGYADGIAAGGGGAPLEGQLWPRRG